MRLCHIQNASLIVANLLQMSVYKRWNICTYWFWITNIAPRIKWSQMPNAGGIGDQLTGLIKWLSWVGGLLQFITFQPINILFPRALGERPSRLAITYTFIIKALRFDVLLPRAESYNHTDRTYGAPLNHNHLTWTYIDVTSKAPITVTCGLDPAASMANLADSTFVQSNNKMVSVIMIR